VERLRPRRFLYHRAPACSYICTAEGMLDVRTANKRTADNHIHFAATAANVWWVARVGLGVIDDVQEGIPGWCQAAGRVVDGGTSNHTVSRVIACLVNKVVLTSLSC
jgi:hypothetical protein